MTDKAVTLRECLKVLNEAVVRTVLYFETIDRNNIPELASSYKLLKDNVQVLEDITKIAKGLQTKISYEVLPDSIENSGFDSVTVKGYLYTVGVRLNASIPEDMRPAGHEWLKENGYSAIIIPQVNAKTLSSAMKSYIEEKAKNPPEDAVKIHRQKYISVTKK